MFVYNDCDNALKIDVSLMLQYNRKITKYN